MKLVCAACRQRGTLGVYANGTVYQPEFYLNASQPMEDGELPLLDLVWMGLYRREEGLCGYTDGLAAFGKEEIEVLDTQAAPGDLHSFLLDLASYVLEEDVTFHDGTPFNADAVVYTFDKQFENPLTAYITTYYTACEKVDDYTVKITKATPHVALLPMMAEGPFIVSPTAYEKGAEEFAKNPVGTGAYKFESQGADQYIHLVANEDYFDGAPYFKKPVNVGRVIRAYDP